MGCYGAAVARFSVCLQVVRRRPQNPAVRRLSMEKQLNRYIAIALLLVSSAFSPRASCAEPIAATAQEILDRTYEVYANCRTYRDSGIATDETNDANGKRTNKKAVAIAFVRPIKFRYEYVADDHKYIIWMDGSDVQKWWTISGTPEKLTSLDMAVAAAAGVSRLTSVTIPSLLHLDGVYRRDLIRSKDAIRIDDERIGESDCFRLSGVKHSWDTTIVWIEKSTYLVRRIECERDLGATRRTRTMTFSPIVNQPVDKRFLEFNHP